MKLLALLLAPVSRIHAYLGHIQVSGDGFESALFITRHKTKTVVGRSSEWKRRVRVCVR